MKQIALYLPCCFPNEKHFFDILDLMDFHKIDVLELGIPVDNPHMDGEIIKSSHKHVLNHGFNKKDLIKTLEKIKRKYSFKVVLMTYNEGIEKFKLLSLDKNLIDGLLCVDSFITCEVFPVPIQIYNETMSDQAIKSNVKNNCFFAYCMTGTGKTGSFKQVPKNYIHTMKRIKEHSDIPIFVGFGIKDEKDAAKVFDNGADGAIIGSHFVNIVKNNSLKDVSDYLFKLKSII